jgi:hypothetical protein
MLTHSAHLSHRIPPTYGASDLKPTRRQAPLGGDGDDWLLVYHRVRTLENPISRPLNKKRSVRLGFGLPPVTQSRDVLKESRPRIEKAWTTYYNQGPHHFARFGHFVRRVGSRSLAPYQVCIILKK